ncbi:hypothetical protein [Paenibacillus contaminans]|uniref:N-acetyltransferase domain-containing protein n=1 Tax=Paenibacillus contaminans TaxID=450362 RepID=A0A329MLZ5_9BACL|nr:hypothetical protein [Paenibacillus contaminans]RAV20622.1 hypothetical protein DQG23_13995 [Paenibacillus contaminans]
MNPNSIENETIRLTLQSAKEYGLIGKRRKRNKYRHLVFAIVRKGGSNDGPMGTISLKETDLERREALIVGPDWDDAAADTDTPVRDAVQLLCKFAFDALRVEEIVIYIRKCDTDYFALCRSCGFTSTGSINKGEGLSFYEMRICSG